MAQANNPVPLSPGGCPPPVPQAVSRPRRGLSLEDMAARRGMPVDELARWLAPDL